MGGSERGKPTTFTSTTMICWNVARCIDPEIIEMCEQLVGEEKKQVAFCPVRLSDPFLIHVRKYQF